MDASNHMMIKYILKYLIYIIFYSFYLEIENQFSL